MKIKTLVENTSVSDEFACAHGLCLYIETQSHKILFDVGASDLFFENAKKMHVDIADIDYLVISHGHYDHGGGLGVFLQKNKKAEVFLHRQAFERFFAKRPDCKKMQYIGLEDEHKENKQIVFTSDRFFITKGLHVFSNISTEEQDPKTNIGLLAEQNGKLIDDSFMHEQSLIVEEDGKSLLVTGCSHNGIINIIEHFYKLKGYMPDFVVGGLHLSSRSSGSQEDAKAIDSIGEYLLSTSAMYYTCHCTGVEAYNRLKPLMGDKIEYLATGSEIEI